MSVVKDKIVLCQIGLADFSIESVNQVPFYKRYSEFCRLFASKIPAVDFESCFAQPQENNAKKTIEWYFKPGTESPMKLSELKDSDPELYNRLAQQRNEIVNNIRTALNKANENDQKYLKAVLSGFDADYIDSITYGYDGHVLMGIWGMRTKTGRQIDSVITEGVLDHRAYRVIYQIQGDGRVSPFTSINRRYGHILHGDKDIPRVTANDGSYFKEWIPEAPHGKEVKSDMVYTAVCEKEEKPSGSIGGDEAGGGSGGIITDPPYGPENNKCQVRFSSGDHGSISGQALYEKNEGETVLAEEVPFVEAHEGYKFLGWDKNPDGYVVTEDIEFVAQYEEEEQHYEVRFDEGSHGILHGQTLFEKRRNEKVFPSEVPEVEPEDGYRFIGWDKNPNNHFVTEDVVFVAQYEEVKESWWSRFWGWGSGCLNWLLTLLLAGLIGLLLWYLLSGYQRFNFCGCDCDEPEPQELVDPVVTPTDPPTNPPTNPPTDPVPHTGDVQILLSWSNYNDLDLSCVDPYNQEVWFQRKKVPSGGELDVDMNAGGPKRNNPIENIYWPTGGAPKGQYTVYLTYYAKNDPTQKETPYTIKVKHGDETDTYTGVIQEVKQRVKICTFSIE